MMDEDIESPIIERDYSTIEKELMLRKANIMRSIPNVSYSRKDQERNERDILENELMEPFNEQKNKKIENLENMKKQKKQIEENTVDGTYMLTEKRIIENNTYFKPFVITAHLFLISFWIIIIFLLHPSKTEIIGVSSVDKCIGNSCTAAIYSQTILYSDGHTDNAYILGSTNNDSTISIKSTGSIINYVPNDAYTCFGIGSYVYGYCSCPLAVANYPTYSTDPWSLIGEDYGSSIDCPITGVSEKYVYKTTITPQDPVYVFTDLKRTRVETYLITYKNLQQEVTIVNGHYMEVFMENIKIIFEQNNDNTYVVPQISWSPKYKHQLRVTNYNKYNSFSNSLACHIQQKNSEYKLNPRVKEILKTQMTSCYYDKYKNIYNFRKVNEEFAQSKTLDTVIGQYFFDLPTVNTDRDSEGDSNYYLNNDITSTEMKMSSMNSLSFPKDSVNSLNIPTELFVDSNNNIYQIAFTDKGPMKFLDLHKVVTRMLNSNTYTSSEGYYAIYANCKIYVLSPGTKYSGRFSKIEQQSTVQAEHSYSSGTTLYPFDIMAGRSGNVCLYDIRATDYASVRDQYLDVNMFPVVNAQGLYRYNTNSADFIKPILVKEFNFTSMGKNVQVIYQDGMYNLKGTNIVLSSDNPVKTRRIVISGNFTFPKNIMDNSYTFTVESTIVASHYINIRISSMGKQKCIINYNSEKVEGLTEEVTKGLNTLYVPVINNIDMDEIVNGSICCGNLDNKLCKPLSSKLLGGVNLFISSTKELMESSQTEDLLLNLKQMFVISNFARNIILVILVPSALYQITIEIMIWVKCYNDKGIFIYNSWYYMLFVLQIISVFAWLKYALILSYRLAILLYYKIKKNYFPKSYGKYVGATSPVTTARSDFAADSNRLRMLAENLKNK